MRPSRPRSALSCADRHYRSIGRPFDSTFTGADLVADFTYVRVRSGFVYAAFAVDAFAGTILGWDLTATANAAMVERALADALQTRRCQGHPIRPGTIHHSDAGTQGGFKWSSQHLDAGGVHVVSGEGVLRGRRQRGADRAMRPGLRSPGGPAVSGGAAGVLAFDRCGRHRTAEASRSACRGRWARGGSGTVAACRRSGWPNRRADI